MPPAHEDFSIVPETSSASPRTAITLTDEHRDNAPLVGEGRVGAEPLAQVTQVKAA